MSTEDNKTVIRRIFDGFNQKDVAVMDELCTPDFVNHDPAYPQVRSLEDFKQFITGFIAAFPDLHFTIDDILAEEDKVAYRFILRATHSGSWRGAAPTGQPINVTATSIARIRDGKSAELWANTDALGIVQQLGAIPASAQGNARLIQTLLDAFNAKDTAPHAALSTADFEVLDVPSGRTFKGPDGHRQFVQSWLTGFPDGQVQATSLFTTEDQGHLEYLARGTNTGPFPYASGQIPPTGRRVEFRVSAGFQFREGKVASIHYYYDLLSVLQQLGLVPTKEGRLVSIS
jgi:steroid delta-isomerase-like uncharacterized protein